MQKKILILGAGVYQVPLILKAKEMGLYTIAASYAGPYPGLAIADEVWEIDTTDYHALLEKAEAAQISGVCTTGTDVSVISVTSAKSCICRVSRFLLRALPQTKLP